MQYNEFIGRNPVLMGGKPIITGTRITIELIVRKMANGYSIEQLLESYPHLTCEQVAACMSYAEKA